MSSMTSYCQSAEPVLIVPDLSPTKMLCKTPKTYKWPKATTASHCSQQFCHCLPRSLGNKRLSSQTHVPLRFVLWPPHHWTASQPAGHWPDMMENTSLLKLNKFIAKRESIISAERKVVKKGTLWPRKVVITLDDTHFSFPKLVLYFVEQRYSQKQKKKNFINGTRRGTILYQTSFCPD